MAKPRVSRVPPPTRPAVGAEKPSSKGGRPAHAPTEESRRQVEAMALRFLSQKSIAAIIGLSEDTLRKHYPAELDIGGARAELAVRDGLHKLAQKGNARALIHLSKAKLGDSEKVQLEHSGSVAGKLDVYLRMDEGELKKRLAQLDEALAE